jgi:hypothetical protein
MMSIIKLEAALPQLIIRSKAKRLRPLWPAIEARLAEGASHAEILRLLNEIGFQLTLSTYKSYLYRYRKRRRTTTQRSSQLRLIETETPQSVALPPAMMLSVSAEIDKHKRPPRFEFDPSGISPELLK